MGNIIFLVGLIFTCFVWYKVGKKEGENKYKIINLKFNLVWLYLKYKGWDDNELYTFFIKDNEYFIWLLKMAKKILLREKIKNILTFK